MRHEPGQRIILWQIEPGRPLIPTPKYLISLESRLKFILAGCFDSSPNDVVTKEAKSNWALLSAELHQYRARHLANDLWSITEFLSFAGKVFVQPFVDPPE